MEERRKFQGVINILSFNRHYYIFGVMALVILVLSQWLIQWPQAIFWIVIAAFLYGLIAPLLISAYVYDFSGFYEFSWMNEMQKNLTDKKLIISINAGFDETSFILANKFPGTELRVFDFYNSKQHTEPAIVRARKVSTVYPNTQHIESGSIPLNNQSADIIFLLSAVHEIRSHEEKIMFLKECHRACKTSGEVVMVEHLRDFPNFLAFSVGFTHFFSKSTWQNAFESAGFSTFQERKFTPFISIFRCKP